VAKQKVTVPDIGGAEGAEVIELLVAVGDEVELDQGLIVLESDKASMEIPATAAGRVAEMLVSEGDQLSEGAPVAVIETGDEAGETTEDSGDAADATSAAEETPAAGAGEPSPAGGSEHGDSAPSSTGDGEEAGSAAAAGESREVVVRVPDIGTDEAVDLIEVLVRVGDTLSEGDSIVVLESDKASMEVPSPTDGEVQKILVSDGVSVREGDELLILRAGAGDGTASAPEEAAPEEAAAATQPGESEAPESTGQRSAGPAQGRSGEPSGAKPAEKASSRQAAAASAAAPGEPARVYAGPAVRKLAREFGIQLDQVRGTGPRGRILKEDLQQFVSRSLSGESPVAAAGAGIPPVPEVDFAAFGEVEATERSKLDKLTAANMQRSWLNLPHVTQFDEADVTELEDFRAGLKGEAEQRGTRLTPLPFLLKACAVALQRHPKFNSSLAEGGKTLVFKRYVHIGMAVDTPAGLVVPVIRDVDKKSIWELAEEVLAMADRARDRKLKPGDMQGGCFTVSSLGGIGGTGFTPIINAPEVGILGVSRLGTKPVWDGQAFIPRKMLPLALSYDHRVINGSDGGRFMTELVTLLGDIRRLVL
jgi:pyruvate dehydrogenase E2 component (dihydrolipoamide acetyltransferase)